MNSEQRIRQLEEEMRHEQEMRRLQGDRLDAHDASLSHVSTLLETITSRLDLTTMAIDQLVASQAKTEAMLQNLIEAITRDHSNGSAEAK